MSDKILIAKIKKIEKDFNKKIFNIQLDHKKKIQKILDKIELRKARKNI
jgi:hypothetical protein